MLHFICGQKQTNRTTTSWTSIQVGPLEGIFQKRFTLERSPRLTTWRCMDVWCMFSHPKLKGTSWKVALRNACSLGTMFNSRFIMRIKKILVTKDVVFGKLVFSLPNIQDHKTLEDMIIIPFDHCVFTT
jgi:hypothetical protein